MVFIFVFVFIKTINIYCVYNGRQDVYKGNGGEVF